jgi:hypothetical protein
VAKSGYELLAQQAIATGDEDAHGAKIGRGDAL